MHSVETFFALCWTLFRTELHFIEHFSYLHCSVDLFKFYFIFCTCLRSLPELCTCLESLAELCSFIFCQTVSVFVTSRHLFKVYMRSFVWDVFCFANFLILSTIVSVFLFIFTCFEGNAASVLDQLCAVLINLSQFYYACQSSLFHTLLLSSCTF